ncbi:MAG: hypothetical protein H8D94_00790 [Candidatus Pelagibacter sp.]|nr:hypothetical protein [Candidatus Pelagibacter sp.]
MNESFYKSVNNYTKFKLVDMLIRKHQEDKLHLDNLNAMESLADDIIDTLTICGLKFSNQLNKEFGE